MDAAAGDAADELVEQDCLGRTLGELLAREHEQVVGEPCQTRRVCLELRDDGGVHPVPGEVRDVPPQGGQRGSQLVRGVGEEAALGVPRPLEAAEHRVQRGGECAHLVAGVRLRQAARRVAGSLDLRSRPCERAERAEGAPHQQRDGDPCQDRSGDPGPDDEQVQAVERLLEVGGGRRHDDGAAGRRPAQVGERRRVGAQPLVGARHVRVSGPPAADRARELTLYRESAAAERERAGDKPALAIDDLDRQLCPAERRVEGAGRRQHGRRRGCELRDRDRAPAKRCVERVMQVARDEHVRRRAGARDREQDRRRRRGDRAPAQREPAHSSTKPTPRTVSISGGSPSFARRYET